MPPQSRNRRDILVGVAAIEFIALLIGLAMPITPSKTGADGSVADLLFLDPSYLQEALVYFVLTNLLFGILILVAWMWERVQATRTARSDDPPLPPEV